MRSGHLLLRGVAVAFGLSIIALVAGDWLRVTRAGETAIPGHIPAMLLGLMFVVLGLLGGKIAAVLRGTALVLLQVVLLVLVVDAVSGAVLWNRARVRNVRQASDMAALPYYKNVPWGIAYWAEFAKSDAQFYIPFTAFRRRPFAGQFINVGADRLRATPGANCAPGSYLVYALGGSTMWGTGAPDSGTIAAYLQRGFAQRVQRPVCVVNFGESAYVVTQGLIGLSLALRAGARPDLVISYDGVNDVFAAYQSGHAGIHQNEASIASGYPRPHWALEMLKASATFRLLRGNGSNGGGITDALAPAQLADSVARMYLGSVQQMRALGAAYAFQTLF
ncbi:MAG: SGNH/GDSL hydrolase family protein [Gemmatimonadaceae bacterium]